MPTGGSSSGSGTGSWWGSGAGSSGGTTSSSGSGSSSNSGSGSVLVLVLVLVVPGVDLVTIMFALVKMVMTMKNQTMVVAGGVAGDLVQVLDPVLVLVLVIPALLQLLVDRLEAGGVDLVTIMFALVKMATMMKMIKLLNQSVTMRMIAGMMMKSVTQAAKEVVNSVTVAAESVYPSTTAASLTTSWISTQTAQSVTQIENIGGKVSASGLWLFLGCC